MGDCVVDTCVLRSVGASDAIESSSCLRVVCAIENAGHFVVCSKSLWDEWQRHISKRAAIWQSQMISREQILFYEPSAHHTAEIDQHMLRLAAHKQRIAAKDKHVICLAVSANALVISSEVACRVVFVELGRLYPPISAVNWVSPLTCANLITWLTSPTVIPLEWQLVSPT